MGGHRVAFVSPLPFERLYLSPYSLGDMVGPRHHAHLDVVKLDKRPLRTFNFYYRPKGKHLFEVRDITLSSRR
jgi:hypothetical protein